MIFNNTYGSGVSDAFKAAILTAENFFKSYFSNSVTLNLSFDLQLILPTPTGQISSGMNTFSPIPVTYADLVSALSAHATSTDDLSAIKSLPSSDPSGGAGFDISVGMARILGLASGGTGIDDTIVLNSLLPWTYGVDAIGVLEHEISEGVMGRIGGLGIQNGQWGPMDLFRYSAPQIRDYTGGKDGLPTFFSVDGASFLTQFHNGLNTSGVYDQEDFADWNAYTGDAFGPGGPGYPGTVSPIDLRVLDILGWTRTDLSAPPAAANFTALDMTENVIMAPLGDPYSGPVSGLDHQYINITSDSLNITALVRNSFIHTGSGTDVIDVSKVGGTNVIDGSTGSNFLVGGSGSDTFFVDNRQPVADIWSTVDGFHKGDAATIWGVAPADFHLGWMDGQGATGYTGLTLHVTDTGKPTASLTLANYTKADLGNGRLSVSFGADLASGSSYMYIHGN